jgi:hypothetical protein
MRKVATGAILWGVAFLLGAALRADSVEGARRWSENLKPRQFIFYEVEFEGGKPAQFAVIGDGATDVDVYVFVLGGNNQPVPYPNKAQQIFDNTDNSDIASVRWVPQRTQKFLIKVENLGEKPNKCYLGHN